MNTTALMRFIRERHAVYMRKANGEPWPWTQDPILQKYRFCNVYRNLDKQSALIQGHWSRQSQDNWFAFCVARLVNWWPTLEAVGYPVPWRPERFKQALHDRKEAGQKVFTGAYMVRADPHADGSKGAYLADKVLTPIWEARRQLRPRRGDTLDAFHHRLMSMRDMGSFMAAQVVADAKYVDPALMNASDWLTWAASGPGSRRGLNRVLGRPVNTAWTEDSWRLLFMELWQRMFPLVQMEGLPDITGQDLQNCLCEWDKYERVRLGEGLPRSLYVPLQA